MSHFFTVVLVPGDTPEDQMNACVDQLLAPYDENLETEPYKVYLEKDETTRMYAFYEEHPSENPGNLGAMIADYFGGSHPGGQDEQGLYRVSTYNPKSKWDWYCISGRWHGEIRNMTDGEDPFASELGANSIATKLIDHEVKAFAIVTPDGEWHEKGKMGWWAMVSNEKEPDEWDKEIIRLFREHQDTIAIGMDLHI